MRSVCIQITVLCIAVMSGWNTSQASDFFDDHGNGGLGSWERYGRRYWYENNGAAYPANYSLYSGFLIKDNPCANNGTIEVKITANQKYGQNGGVVFRWQSTSRYYFVCIRPDTGSASYLKFCKNTLAANNGSTIGTGFAVGSTFDLKIVLNNDNFKFFVDNTYIGEVYDNTHTSGNVGYAYTDVYNSYIQFNEIRWTEVVGNNAPSDINLSKSFIEEGKAVGTLVGLLTTKDIDANDTHEYSLVGGEGDADNEKFSIQGDSLLSSVVFNHQLQSSYSVRIKTTDNGTGNLSYEKVFVITIREIEDLSQWNYSQKITFNTTDSGAGISEDVYNFPVLVRLDSTRFNFTGAKEDGQDIRFVSSDGTQLPYEIETWNASTKEASIWINVPLLKGNSNQDFIIMYSANPYAESKSNPAEVFGVSNGFLGVWHCSEEMAGVATANVYKDATENGFHGTDYITTTTQTGMVGKGHDFNGTSDFIDIPGIPRSNYEYFSASIWVKPDNQTRWADLFGKEDDNYFTAGFGLKRSDSDRFNFTWNNGARQELYSSEPFIDDGTTWYNVAFTFEKNVQKLYINGILNAVSQVEPALIVGAASNLKIGKRGSYADREFDGALDELRVSTTVRSSDWIKLCYENQRQDSKLLSFSYNAIKPVVTISPIRYIISEGDKERKMFRLRAAMPVAPYADKQLQIDAAVSGTAHMGIDYYELLYPFTLTIQSGTLSDEIEIPLLPVDDNAQEGNETVIISLLPDSAFIIGGMSAAQIVIEDNDLLAAPQIIKQPESVNAYNGDIVTLEIYATGNPKPQYQWMKNGNPVVGAESDVYITPPVSLSDSATVFTCSVTNAQGAVVSSPAILTVTERPVSPRIVQHPMTQNAVIGDTVQFFVVATGQKPLSYEWYTDTGRIYDAHDSIFTVGPVTKNDNKKKFYCRVTNAVGAVNTRTAMVIISKPTSQQIVLSGELYNFEGIPVGYAGTDFLDFQISLYTSLNSDSAVYRETFLTENQQAIEVNKGTFVVRSGQGITEHDIQQVVRMYPNLFVSFAIAPPGGNLETLQPRTPLTASPYALSGIPELLKGQVNPNAAGIEAPVGTHYVNTLSNTTYIKTYTIWVELKD